MHPPPLRKLHLLVIFLVALVARLTLVHATVSHIDAGNFPPELRFDCHEYLLVSRNVAEHGSLSGPTPLATDAQAAETSRIAHHTALLRPPAYPVFCAAFFALGFKASAILWTQALLGALIPVLVAVLAQILLKNRPAALASGFLSAISPAGIGVTGLVMADLPLALVFIIGMFFLVRTILHPRWTSATIAGSALAAGVLLKPLLLFFPGALLLIAPLLAHGLGRRVPWRHVAAVALFPLLATAGWCARNDVVEGRWTFSSITGQNLHHYLGCAVDMRSRQPGHTFAQLEARQDELRWRDWSDLLSGRVSPADIDRRQRAEAFAVLRAHPLDTLLLSVSGALGNCHPCWLFFPRQIDSAHPLFGFFKFYGSPIPTTIALVIAALLWIIAFIASTRAALRRDGRDTRPLALDAALLVMFLYVVALSGTSFAVGPRVVYPVEFAILLLAVRGGSLVVQRLYPRKIGI